jgi:preprotein translocase subunit SecB
MAEENGGAQPAEGAAPQPQLPKMQVLGQFIRDMSFENIMVQKGVGGEVTPEISVQVALDAKKRPTDHQFEVLSKYSITSKNKGTDQTLFMLELEYGGIFHVENVPEDQMHPFLMIECPRMLFPFVRRVVADTTREGGFPPLNLETVDFVALYRQILAQRAQQEAKDAGPVS